MAKPEPAGIATSNARDDRRPLLRPVDVVVLLAAVLAGVAAAFWLACIEAAP